MTSGTYEAVTASTLVRVRRVLLEGHHRFDAVGCKGSTTRILRLLGVESGGSIPLGRIPPVRRDRNKEEVRLQRTKGAVARINLIGNKESTYAEEERERDNNGS